MELRKIPFKNTTVVTIMDDGDNVIAAGAFKDKEDIEEVARMVSVLLANLGFVNNISTGVLPMPYKEFRALLDLISTK